MQTSKAYKNNSYHQQKQQHRSTKKSNKEEKFLVLVALQIYLGRLYLTLIAITFSCRCIRQKL